MSGNESSEGNVGCSWFLLVGFLIIMIILGILTASGGLVQLSN